MLLFKSSPPSNLLQPDLPSEETDQRLSQIGGINVKHPNFLPLSQTDLPFTRWLPYIKLGFSTSALLTIWVG